ncbi:ras-specific guanine nucleotide-releasing factor RalGPS2-like isoform X3 [Aphidius gifuensis]|uniref:ras-specific guanine nucleotide-releasing factor RalGPS2-like isoform X3 n=1 Tax=Aphidius gifuensis TaxID=684658 RepID=UPI001CDBB09E|nr:ras-specific guanine nucleotide-releasing factor RalGPS2-like isoform X3 [Aphidius gifuensis]
MYYTAISRDFPGESISPYKISKFGTLECRGKSFVNDTNSPSGPLLPGEMNQGDKNYKERKEHRDKYRPHRKYSELTPSSVNTSYDNYGNSVSSKSNSLPGRCNTNLEGTGPLVATGISSDDLATQLTLLDLVVFKAIKPEELSSCSWNKKNKLLVAPNVVDFTRRFNHVSFWTVQEILNFSSPKQRCEVIAHFIRVAKKLYDLNNMHSLFAIISGLQSAPIYRLTKTWSYLTKKDKASFDKLAEVFSDKNNWMNLREHMSTLKLPCIPYLGLFLTDLVYIDMAHPPSKNNDNHQRAIKMNTVLTRVTVFQASEYSTITVLADVQKYLNSVRYIEELQKFLEDDHFKLSMKLEPNSPVASSSSSKESVGDVATGVAALSLSPARGCAGSLRLHAASAANKFVPGHRKCRSLGTNIFGKSNGANLETGQMTVRHLLDDSVLEEPHVVLPTVDLDQNSPCTPTDAINDDCSLLSRTSTLPILPCDIDGVLEPRCSMQGLLKRKVILRDGRKPAVTTWQKYWIQLWASSIVFFSPKCFKGGFSFIFSCDRSDFKREPHKMVSILGWIVESADSMFHKDSFLLTDPNKGNIYKFRAISSDFAEQWVKEMRGMVRGVTEKKPLPANLMSFE